MVPPGARWPLADAARGVALGIADRPAGTFWSGEGECGGQIDRRGGLSDAALLICDGDDHPLIYCLNTFDLAVVHVD